MQSVPILYFIAMFAHSVLLQEHALRTFVPDPCHTGERERESWELPLHKYFREKRKQCEFVFTMHTSLALLLHLYACTVCMLCACVHGLANNVFNILWPEYCSCFCDRFVRQYVQHTDSSSFVVVCFSSILLTLSSSSSSSSHRTFFINMFPFRFLLQCYLSSLG